MRLTINSNFRPFTYDDLIKPLLTYKDAYDKVEADYTNLVTQTEAWKDIVNQSQNPEAYGMYSAYSKDLNDAVDELSRGMTPKTRQKLLAMKGRYNQSITPIANAKKELDKAIAYRQELKAKNPGVVFEKDNYNSLDDFLHGKVANNNYVDTNAMMKQAATEFSNLGKAFFSDPKYSLFANGYKLKAEQLNGMTPEELDTVLNSPENINTPAGKAYRDIYDRYLSSTDYFNNNKYSDAGRNQIKSALYAAASEGLAKPKYEYLDSGKEAAQNYGLKSESLRMQKAENEWKKQVALTTEVNAKSLTPEQARMFGWVGVSNSTPTGNDTPAGNDNTKNTPTTTQSTGSSNSSNSNVQETKTPMRGGRLVPGEGNVPFYYNGNDSVPSVESTQYTLSVPRNTATTAKGIASYNRKVQDTLEALENNKAKGHSVVERWKDKDTQKPVLNFWFNGKDLQEPSTKTITLSNGRKMEVLTSIPRDSRIDKHKQGDNYSLQRIDPNDKKYRDRADLLYTKVWRRLTGKKTGTPSTAELEALKKESYLYKDKDWFLNDDEYLIVPRWTTMDDQVLSEDAYNNYQIKSADVASPEKKYDAKTGLEVRPSYTNEKMTE